MSSPLSLCRVGLSGTFKLSMRKKGIHEIRILTKNVRIPFPRKDTFVLYVQKVVNYGY